MELEELLEDLREYGGFRRKASIGAWARRFRVPGSGANLWAYGPGDDAGAVAFGDGHLLLAAEGLQPRLMEDPAFAGFCAVTVNVNDIYAMGGRPLGVTAVVFAGGLDEVDREAFLDGFDRACGHYGVPMLGGHTSPEGKTPNVAVAIAGFTKTLLRGDGAAPGDRLLFAADLDGERHLPFDAWDSVTRESGPETLGKLEALLELAGGGLPSACRDVSNPGLLGTLAMMLEQSGCGADVSLQDVPVPAGVELSWWLRAYPSCGFLLAAPADRADRVALAFTSRGLACAPFGEVAEGSRLIVRSGSERALFVDWREAPVTGLFGY